MRKICLLAFVILNMTSIQVSSQTVSKEEQFNKAINWIIGKVSAYAVDHIENIYDKSWEYSLANIRLENGYIIVQEKNQRLPYDGTITTITSRIPIKDLRYIFIEDYDSIKTNVFPTNFSIGTKGKTIEQSINEKYWIVGEPRETSKQKFTQIVACTVATDREEKLLARFQKATDDISAFIMSKKEDY